jgi:hypothetical protein
VTLYHLQKYDESITTAKGGGLKYWP